MLLAPAALLLSAAGCTGDDKYSIECTAKGLGLQNLKLVYIADGEVCMAQTTSLDDTFSFSGKLEAPAMMDVYSGSGALLARVLVSPGEKIELALDINDYGGSQVKGSDATSRLVAFLADGKADETAEARNGRIAAYVDTHRDDPVSAVLVTGYYDVYAGTVSRADSLLGLVSADARRYVPLDSYTALLGQGLVERTRRLPASIKVRTTDADSAVTVKLRGNRRTLLAIQDVESRAALAAEARQQRATLTAPDVRLVEYMLAEDSLQWMLTLRSDTLPGRWTEAFSPAGVMDMSVSPLGVTRVPCYIVTDSAGRYLCRTSDAAEALKALK